MDLLANVGSIALSIRADVTGLQPSTATAVMAASGPRRPGPAFDQARLSSMSRATAGMPPPGIRQVSADCRPVTSGP